jgi:Leucine-rich repeat (LRR) protein
LSGFLSDKNSFSSVPFLTSLDLSKLKAHSFAEGCLSPLVDTLEHLRWEKGGLASVPGEIYKMKHLKTLRLGDNRIESIERSIANLQNLDELDVKNNELAQLPPDLGLLSLRSLQLEGNPLRSIRRAVIEKGTTAVLAYLKDKMPIA